MSADYEALPLDEQVASLLEFVGRYNGRNAQHRRELRMRVGSIRAGVYRLEAENRDLREHVGKTMRRYHYGNTDTRRNHV